MKKEILTLRVDKRCRDNPGLKYILEGQLHLVLGTRESFKARQNIDEATCVKQDEWLWITKEIVKK